MQTKNHWLNKLPGVGILRCMMHPKATRSWMPVAWWRTVVWAAAVAVGLLPLAGRAAGPGAAPAPPRIEGLWVWKARYITDAADRDELLAFCRRQGFNRLLVQVPWKHGTAPVVQSPPSQKDPLTDGRHPQVAFPVEFARLIADAAKQHVVVEALDGEPYMGDRSAWPQTMATVDALVAFNATLPQGARLAGIHWDIEPYTRPDWKVQATRVPIETDYLQMLTDAKAKLAGTGLTLAVDIPMWYDNKTAPDDNCIVTFNGQTKNFHQHIQDITDYVGIMSYRQKALGKNSASDMVANELAYAEQIGKRVCPAYETVRLDDTPTITFYGKPAEQLQAQRQALEAALGNRPGFGGMFIHCYPAVCAVLEPGTAVK
jgi:hypothetical protein